MPLPAQAPQPALSSEPPRPSSRRPRPRRPRLRALTMLMAFSTGALLGGCADKPTEPTAASTSTPHPVATSTPSTAPPTTATPTSQPRGTSPYPPGTPEHEVATAYIEGVTQYFLAGESPEVASELDRYFASPALEAAQANVRRLAESGVRSVFPDGPPSISIESVDLTAPTQAAVLACVIDTGHRQNIATGESEENDPISRRTEATLMFDGHWRIVATSTVTKWENRLECSR